MTERRHDLNEIYERIHSIALRVGLQPAARAQAIQPTFSHAKPEASEPDLSLLVDLRSLEEPLIFWLERAEEDYEIRSRAVTILERFHAALIVVDERDLDNLVKRLGHLEERIRIRWHEGIHWALPPADIIELRKKKQRQILYVGYGLRTSRLERVLEKDGMNLGRNEVRDLRRRHGIDGRNGTRGAKCLTAIRERLHRDGCELCQVVDDLERESHRKRA